VKVLHDIFKRIEKQPDDKGICFITEEGKAEKITYHQLYTDSLYVLHNLQQHGLKEGSQLVLQIQSDIVFVKIFWACILGKILPVPITFGLGDMVVDKIEKVIDILDDPFIISDVPAYEQRVRDAFSMDFFRRFGSGVSRFLDSLPLLEKVQKASPVQVQEDDVAFLQFSSGSTSDPKGVMNTHKAVIQNVIEMSYNAYMTEDERVLGWMPLTHDMGIVFFHTMPLYLNADQYLMPPMLYMTKPHLWVEMMAKYKITVSGSPNFGYAYYVNNCAGKAYPPGSLASLKFLANGAEQINPEVCYRFVNELSPYGMAKDVIRPTYGLAEAALMVTGQKNRAPIEVLWVNRLQLKAGENIQLLTPEDDNAIPFVNLGIHKTTDVIIKDSNNCILPEKSVGVIHIKGPCVTKGYYNNPEATAAQIDAEGWLNTGDLGFLINDELVIVGRQKEVIIHRGQNYYPNDIDNVIESVEWMKDRRAASVGVYNEKIGQDEVIVFITHAGPIADFVPGITAVRKVAATKAGVDVSRVLPVNMLPKTTSGKIQRYRLRDMFINGEFDDAAKEVSALLLKAKPNQLNIAKTEIEKQIVEMLSRHLQVETVNVRDNFFDMGATSIVVHSVKNEIEEKYGIVIDEVALYKYPNIKILSGYLSELLGNNGPAKQYDRKEALDNAKKVLRKTTM
jgi:acyl-CoA synthetase (AMP-forming)/AMP-acid ligase II/acyl carrier protein